MNQLPVTRKAAKAASATRFFTGQPCVYGHLAERVTSSGNCTECSKLKKQSYRKRERTRVNAANRSYRATNGQRVRAREKEYRAGCAQRLESNRRRYIAANTEKHNARAARRRAAMSQRTPPWADPRAIEAIYAQAARRTIETGVQHEVDHFYPLLGKTVCGLHVPENLRVITMRENRAKSNRVIEA